jgi:phosphoribosyl-ATP pyrophosphohydrolase/phosphoribosyl-AMP cyclohydrolase
MSDEFLNAVHFDVNGLVPAVIQDHLTGEVLMVAFMNRESLKETLETGRTVFWSRSRKSVWRKGETSGHVQIVREIRIDCDEDALLVRVEQKNGACHTGRHSCFFRRFEKGVIEEIREAAGPPGADSRILERLSKVIENRKSGPSPGSYVSSLLSKGEDAILKKIIEEAGEVVLSSKGSQSREIVWEVADLWFHTLVLLGHHGLTVDDIYRELLNREGKSETRKK